MPVRERVDTFDALSERHLMKMPTGIAFHAMLFPARYPTSRHSLAARIEDPTLRSPILEEYGRQTQPLLAAGILIQRLVVLHGPDDTANFDLPYVKLLQREYTQLQAQEVEEVRVTWYGRFLLGLSEACEESSPFVDAYTRGIREDSPKASFWAAYPISSKAASGDWQDPDVIAMQHYTNHEFLGNVIATAPFSTDLTTFVGYSRAIFDDPELSMNISDIQV